MRRSAAPSQLQAAKRAKFIVPYKTSKQAEDVTHSHVLGSAQRSDSRADLSVSEITPHADALTTRNICGVTPSQCLLEAGIASNEDTSAVVNIPDSNVNPVQSSVSSRLSFRTFSPPNFVKKKCIGTVSVEDQTSHQTDTTVNTKINSFQLSYNSESDDTMLNQEHGQQLSETQENNVDTQKNLMQIYQKTAPETDQTSGELRCPLKPYNLSEDPKAKLSLHSEDIVDAVDNVSVISFTTPGPATTGFQRPQTVKDGGMKIMATQPESAVLCGYFSVVWCKLSKKKHKKWEGDAVLVTHGRSVTLYDTEGKEIGKGCGYKSSELQSLVEDETLRIGGKEIQVMSKLSEEQFKSGKCFAGAGPSLDQKCVSSKSTSGLFKSFTNPLQKSNKSQSLAHADTSVGKTQTVAPRFDPSAPDALVMPRPTAAHEWQYNKHHSVVVDVVVDPYLSNHLRPHQRDGVVFLYECITGMRNYGGTGAILADDMGLGKTLQCISLVWTLLKQGMYGGKPLLKKVLIITPGSLVKNWSAEFRKWLGQERLQVFAVTGDSKVEEYLKTSVYPVLIISYEMFVRGYELIKKVPFDIVICDEGHRLKNSTIKTTSLISSLDTRRRIVLSGTPIQNDLQEFFAVVDFCNPGVLGSSAAFRRVYESPILMSRQPDATRSVTELGEERAAELSRLTRMFVLRRTQEINNKYLPPKVELVIFCRPSSLQTNVYREILRSDVVRACLMGRGYGSSKGAGAPHLLAIAALKQVCNHPKLIADKVVKTSQSIARGDADSLSGGDSLFARLVGKYQEEMTREALDLEHSGKLAALSIILANIFRSCQQDKVVLVSNHTKTLDLLQQFCRDSDYKYLRLDGHTPTAQRQQIVTRFNSTYSQENIFLLSSKAGGVGLNLVGASRLFLYDIDWNPANDLQAMARVWRDGQKKVVHIYRLLTTGTLEEKVYQRQISKQGLSGAVMDLKASDIQFSQEDLKDLFSFNDATECDTHALLGCQCEGADTEKGNQHCSTPVVRPCQLGARLADKHARNLSMAELLDWQHLKGSSQHIHKSWSLDNTKHFVSFLFWHKSNSESQQQGT